jgi:predicted RNA-binding protein with PIN domain
LVHFLETSRPQGSIKNKVTVIFDGQSGIVQPQRNSFVQVIFSQGQDADSCIKDMVDQARHQRNIVVVTEDKDIQGYVKRLGAKVLSIKDFFKRSQGKAFGARSKGSSSHLAEEQPVSSTLAYRINAELRKIWVK